MIKFLRIASKLIKFTFYAMSAYFIGILVSIALGYFKFASNELPMYYLMAASGLALLSFIINDAASILEKLRSKQAGVSVVSDDENQGDEPIPTNNDEVS